MGAEDTDMALLCVGLLTSTQSKECATMKNRLAVFPIAALLTVACTNVHQTELCVGTRYGKVVEELKRPGDVR